MVVNFMTYKISWDARKLVRTTTLINKTNNLNNVEKYETLVSMDYNNKMLFLSS